MLRGSDRVFRESEWELVPAPGAAADRLRDVTENALLLPALRAYIVCQVSGERCSDPRSRREAVPSLPGPQRENAMGNYLSFLETHYAGTENRNLWFAQVRLMLDAARRSNDAQEKAWILERLRASRNPIISLYALL